MCNFGFAPMAGACSRVTLAFVPVAAAAMVAVVACVGPTSPEPPTRARVRAAVLAVAHGVRAADEACARVAEARQDASLAERCAAAQGRARSALIASEAFLDASEQSSAGCAARPAVVALDELARAVSGAAETRPPAVADALAMAVVIERFAPCYIDARAP